VFTGGTTVEQAGAKLAPLTPITAKAPAIAAASVPDTLAIVNTVLSFMQEQWAAGVVETLRKRLRVNARVGRDSSWRVIPARDFVLAETGVEALKCK
jgi:hypothetical protein